MSDAGRRAGWKGMAVSAILTAACLTPGVAASAGPPQAAAAPPAYTYEVVAGPFTGSSRDLGCGAINDDGDVFFVTPRPTTFNGDVRPAVMKRDAAGGPLVTVARADDRYRRISTDISVNNSDQVAFFVQFLDGSSEALVRAEDNVKTRIAEKGPTGGFSYFSGGPSINEAGTVAFGGSRRDATADPYDDWGLFTGSGSGLRTVVLDRTSRFAVDQGGPTINDRGAVGFTARLDDGRVGVFAADDGGVRTVFGPRQPETPIDLGASSIDDSGRVTFHHRGGTDRILRGLRPPLQTVVAADGTPLSEVEGVAAPAVNDSGGVVYAGRLADGRWGIFAGASATPVVRVGDLVGGRPVQALHRCTDALNESGQVAFTATVSDPRWERGRDVVVRATPR